MHSLDTAGTANLKTHFGCGVFLLLSLLLIIICLFVGQDNQEEGEGMYI